MSAFARQVAVAVGVGVTPRRQGLPCCTGTYSLRRRTINAVTPTAITSKTRTIAHQGTKTLDEPVTTMSSAMAYILHSFEDLRLRRSRRLRARG